MTKNKKDDDFLFPEKEKDGLEDSIFSLEKNKNTRNDATLLISIIVFAIILPIHIDIWFNNANITNAKIDSPADYIIFYLLPIVCIYRIIRFFTDK